MADFYIVPPRLLVGSFDRAAVVNSINTLKGDLTFTADPLSGVKIVTSGNNLQFGLITDFYVKRSGDTIFGNINFIPSGTNYGLSVAAKSSDPGTGTTGALYFNTTTNELKIYDNTGWNSIQSTSGISEAYANTRYLRLDGTNTPTANLTMGSVLFRLGNLATQVIAGLSGQIYYNTDTNQINLYNGSSWVPIGLGITSINVGLGLTSSQNPISTVSSLAINEAADFTWTGYHTFNQPVTFASAAQSFAINKLFIPGQSQGDIIAYNSGGWTRFPIGSVDYVLTVDTSGTALTWKPTAATGITTLNSLTSTIQYFSFGYSGTVPAFSSSGSTHTLNIPLAGSGSTGLISTQAQTIAGQKTFTTAIIGDLTGTATTAGFATTASYSLQAGFGITAGIATTAKNINVVNATTNSAHFLQFSPTATGSGVAVSSNTKISFNPATFILSTSGLAVTASTVSTSSSSGALIVTGGVGIGGSLFVTSSLPSSLSGVVVNNGVITSGSWAGNLITGLYGGTGYNSYTKGDILVGAGNTFIKLAVGTNNYVLTANSSAATGLTWSPTAATGITTLNSLTATQQYFDTGTNGSTFNISSSGSTHTFNIPLAGTGITGLISPDVQTIAGQKTFTSAIIGNLSGTATTAQNINIVSTLQSGSHYLLFTPQSGTVSGGGVSSKSTVTLDPSTNNISIGTGNLTANGVVVGSASNTISTSSGDLKLDSNGGTVIVQGNLNVQGTTTTIDSTVTSFKDPVIVLGAGDGNTHSLVDDNKDRGLEFRYAESGTAITGFFGYKDDKKFYYIPNASVNDNVYTGTAGTIVANLEGTATTSSYSLQSGFATTSSNVNLSTTTENSNFFLTFSKNISGSGVALSSGVGLSFNPFTNTLTADKVISTQLTGTLQTGSQTNITQIGTITSGVWNASAIATTYGGTGLTTYNKGDLLVGTGQSILAVLPKGTDNYYLTSSSIFPNGIGWTTVTGVAITELPPAAPNIADLWWNDNDGSLSIYYNDGNTAQWVEIISGFGGVSPSGGSGTVFDSGIYSIGFYPSAGSGITGSADFINNTSANSLELKYTTQSISTTSGALKIAGGIAISGNVSIGSSILFWNSSNGNYVAFKSGSSTASTTYTFPISSPQGAGTSVLSSTVDGVMSWVPMVATGGANIGYTVFSGNNFELAYYFQNGTGVTGAQYIHNVGTGMSLLYETNSSSTLTGALVIRGGLGVTGNAFIGGTITASTFTGNVTGDVTGNLTGTATTATNINSVAGAADTAHYLLFSLRTNGTGIAVSSGTGLSFNPNTSLLGVQKLSVFDTTDSTSSSTGALLVTSGVGIGQSLSIGGRLQIFNGTNSGFAAFRYTGSGNTVYTLPDNAPISIGASFLTSDLTGNLAWIAAPSGGTGNPGGSDTQIQFNDGGAFGGTSLFTYVKSTNVVSVASTSGQENFYATGLRLINDRDVALSAVQVRNSPGLELVGVGQTGTIPSGGRYNRFAFDVIGEANSFEANLRLRYSWDARVGGSFDFKNLIQFNSIKGLGIGASDDANFNYFVTSNLQSNDISYKLPHLTPTVGQVLSVATVSGTAVSLGWSSSTGSGTITQINAGIGLTTNPNGPITTSGTIIARRIHRIQFASSFNPTLGADSAVFTVPFDPNDGTSSMTMRMKRVECRVETTSALGSSFSIQKYAYRGGLGVTQFNTDSSVFIGSTTNIMPAFLEIIGADTYEVNQTTFAGSHITAVSGDKMRLFFNDVSALHQNFSISLLMEQEI